MDCAMMLFTKVLNKDIQYYPTDSEMVSAMCTFMELTGYRRTAFKELLEKSLTQKKILRDKFNERRGKISGPARRRVWPALGLEVNWDAGEVKQEEGAEPVEKLGAKEVWDKYYGESNQFYF